MPIRPYLYGMLSKLLVRNYAIISSVDIVFSDDLNIITGETGAGKSILVGALGLVLGDRADTSVLRDTAQKAVVEAVFTGIRSAAAAELLSNWDIDASDELILRRELTSSGKSRAFINDTPVNLSQLQQLSALLVDMHLQFDTQDLGRNDFQRAVLDALCDHEALLQQYREAYAEYVRLQRSYESMKEAAAAGSRELDYHQFLYDELADANWQDNEMEELEAELRMLSHADQIRSSLGRICYDLSESEQPVVQQIRTMVSQLQQLGEFHTELPGLEERMQSAFLEIQDISGELADIRDKVQLDAGRMEEVNTRIALGQKLMKKHGVRTSRELLQVQADLAAKVRVVVNAGEELAVLEKKVQSASRRAEQLAEKIGAGRRQQAGPLADMTATLLKRVGMPNAALKVDLQTTAIYEGGSERVQFLFDANRSNRFEALQKVASGGELSRLMLVIKSLVARSLSMPTLIFDEIDSGISGEAAKQVGILMKELAENHQVISITHQPQIAARAHTHFFVYKKEEDGSVQTHIRSLSDKERVEAIARMLGGEKPSAVVLENAKEMIGEGTRKQKAAARK
jgi:DNA repair protein RecN (Recombination protein N)